MNRGVIGVLFNKQRSWLAPSPVEVTAQPRGRAVNPSLGAWA